jgi:hypothetical protein
MNCIKLTHANLKQPMYLAATLIAGFYESPGNRCTHVVASGGAVFPATETPDQIRQLLSSEATSSDTKSDLTERK